VLAPSTWSPWTFTLAAPSSLVVVDAFASGDRFEAFDPGAFDEVRQDASAPLGASGFVPASLLSAFAFEGPLLHGGGATSFDEVLQNVQHRSAGTSGVDTLGNAADRQKIAAFLRSIDAAIVTFP